MKKVLLLILMVLGLGMSQASAFTFYNRNGMTSRYLESKVIGKTSREYSKSKIRTRRLLRNVSHYVRSRMKMYPGGENLIQTMAEGMRTAPVLPKLSKTSLPAPQEPKKKESILLPKVDPKKKTKI